MQQHPPLWGLPVKLLRILPLKFLVAHGHEGNPFARTRLRVKEKLTFALIPITTGTIIFVYVMPHMNIM